MIPLSRTRLNPERDIALRKRRDDIRIRPKFRLMKVQNEGKGARIVHAKKKRLFTNGNRTRFLR